VSYIPATPDQRREMLRVCGVSSVNELFADIPKSLIPPKDDFWAKDGMSELEALTECEKLSSKNDTRLIPFLGGGFYDHYIPAAVDAIVSRSEFYTAYTPYQPELSQGTLQAIYEYQSQICRLTGMEISNASLYDGGTAIFEACKMAAAPRQKIIVDSGVNPIYLRMLRTHTANLGAEIVAAGPGAAEIIGAIDDTVSAVVTQNPNYFGVIGDHSGIVDKCKKNGALSVQSVNPVALALLKTPAEQGFDIAVGEGQPLGIPLSFGGPCLGFIAARKDLARRMPGRIAARTEDVCGRPGFVLSLQAREQHIRREKATSNICSNEALCALRAHVYLSLMGTEGLKEVASLCRGKAIYLRESLKSIPGIEVTDDPIFNEFVIKLPSGTNGAGSRPRPTVPIFIEQMAARGFAAGIPVGAGGHLLIAVTEKRTKRELDDYAAAAGDVLCQ
jgi:glycine dehydrogenase subunit 1